MPLIHVMLVLIVVGVLLWLVNSYIPMAGSIKTILNAVVIIVVVLWLLSVFGLIGKLPLSEWGSNCLGSVPRKFVYAGPGHQDDNGDVLKEEHMPYQPYLAPVVALIAGILILIQPALLSIIVAVYLIAIGILGLMRGAARGWFGR